MWHPDEGELLALVDGEPEREAVAGHVEECEGCQDLLDRLASQRAAISDAIGMLEPGIPSSGGLSELRRRAAGRSGGWAAAFPFGKAALFVLLMAGAGSAAMPGSPVRDWVQGVFRAPAAPEGAPSSAAVGSETGAMDPQGEGVWLALPAEGAMNVTFAGPVGPAGLRLRLVDGERVGAFARGAVEFRTGVSALGVELRGGGAEAHLPRGARDLTVRLDGEVLFRIQAGAVAPGPRLLLDEEGSWFLPGERSRSEGSGR